MVKVAVLGYGTVGSGVVEVLRDNKDIIAKNAGDTVEVKYVLARRELPGTPVEDKVVHDFQVIVNDPEVKIVAEAMGGVDFAYPYVKAALENGKSVCTPNKELVARHGVELSAIAREKNVNFLFEASCGGGIPIIRALNESLTADRIDEISGILNGTTNYILSEMTSEGSDFADVLKIAQEKGYAEKDPAADVEGWDAGRKIAILSSLAFGKYIDFEDVYTEGITKITATDILFAKAWNASIKLIGTCKETPQGCYAMVTPVMLGRKHPLYGVNDVFNAIFVHGNMLGDTMFYGKGAGKLPTASAVVSDIVAAAKNLNENIAYGICPEKLDLVDIQDVENRFYVRMEGKFQEYKEKITSVFGEVEAMELDDVQGEFAIITDRMTEASYTKKIEKFENVLGMIRVRF